MAWRFPVDFDRPVEVVEVSSVENKINDKLYHRVGMGNLTFIPPPGAVWRLKSLRVSCLADVNAGNRILAVLHYRDNQIVWDAKSTPFPLTDRVVMNLMPGGDAYDTAFDPSNLIYHEFRPFPNEFIGGRDFIWIESLIVGVNDPIEAWLIVDEVVR